MVRHAFYHIEQVDAINKKDMLLEATIRTGMKTNAYTIADEMAGGIAGQFPEKF